MREDDPRRAVIAENVRFAIRQFGEARGSPIGFDGQSVEWVEGFIERHRSKYADEEARSGFVSVIGSYLGEAIISASDAEWDSDVEGALGVHFACGAWCYPFTKVDKQFAEGLAGGESILGFYNFCVDVVAKGQVGAPEHGGILQ